MRHWNQRSEPRQPPPATPKAAPKRMRANTKKRAKADRAKQPARRAFAAAAGVCMVCRQANVETVHEIANGAAREKCLDQFDLTLAVCAACHETLHPIKPAVQIAIRAAWFIDVACGKYCSLKGFAPTHVTRNDVLTALEYAPELR